jgi:CBS domain-containing protein
MTHDVRTAAPSTPLVDIVRLMERHHIKRVPVVEGDKVSGIITRANLLHAVASFGDELRSSAGDTSYTRAITCRVENPAMDTR